VPSSRHSITLSKLRDDDVGGDDDNDDDDGDDHLRLFCAREELVEDDGFTLVRKGTGRRGWSCRRQQ
jgi:hypothetical protein